MKGEKMRLIDAEELLIKLQWHCDLNCPYTEKERDIMCNACFLGAAKDEIDSMPTIAAEPIRHGHWEYVKKRLVRGGYVDANKCSICHKIIMPHLKPNYCPDCGAKMEEPTEAAQ